MGMVVVLTTLSDASIDRVLATPALLWRVVAPEDPEILAQALAAEDKRGFFARLFGRPRAVPGTADVPDLPLGQGEANETDLDKAWHGIHFLLTGSSAEGEPPLGFLVAGGVEVSDIEVGYGPARVFRSAQVAEIRDALEAVREEELRRRYRPDVMMKEDVYPAIWDRDPGEEDALGYLLEYFDALKRFIHHAAGEGLGMVVTLQ